MSKSTRRALRVSLTVSGIAVLCASFVGTAAASPSIDEATPDAPNSVSSELPAKPEVGDGQLPSHSDITDSKLLHNGVMDAEVPTIEPASYQTTGFVAVPASEPGDNEDEDEICDDLRQHGVESKLPDALKQGAEVQRDCQTSGNDYKDGQVEVNDTPMAAPVSIPGLDADAGDTITNPAAPVDPNAVTEADPNAVTKNLQAPQPRDLNNLDQKAAVTPV